MAIAPFIIGPAMRWEDTERKWNSYSGRWDRIRLKLPVLVSCEQDKLAPEQKAFLHSYTKVLAEKIRLNRQTENDSPLKFTPRECYAYHNTIENWLKGSGYDKFLEVAHNQSIKTFQKSKTLEKKSISALRHAQQKIIRAQFFVEIVTDWYVWADAQISNYKDKGLIEWKS